MPVDLNEFKRVPKPLAVEVPSTTIIEQALLSAIAGLKELQTKVNANDTISTTKQNNLVTALQTSLNDLYGKLEAIGDMSATDLENLQSVIKSANDIVSNGVNGLVKAIDGMLQVLNNSKNIQFLSLTVDTVEGVASLVLPLKANEIFRVTAMALSKPHNAQESFNIIQNDKNETLLQISHIDLSHFASAKVPFDTGIKPIDYEITFISDKVDLLSFTIETPTEDLTDSIDSKDTKTVGKKPTA